MNYKITKKIGVALVIVETDDIQFADTYLYSRFEHGTGKTPTDVNQSDRLNERR